MHISIIRDLLSLSSSDKLDILSCLVVLRLILLNILNLIGKLLPVWIIKSRGMLLLLALLDYILVCVGLLNHLHVSLCIIVIAQLSKS
jgi:hypothetical protein